jgi:chromosome segregation ATPase
MAKTAPTPVQAALARPLPAGLAAAVQNSKAAQAAFHAAQNALSEFREEARSCNAASAELALSSAIARREIAKRIGDDVTDIEVEVDRLRREHSEATSRLAGRDAIITGFLAEIERCRQVLSSANASLNLTYMKWAEDVLAAADEQLASAARLAGEAQQTAAAMRPQYAGFLPVSFPRISTAGWAHEGPRRAELPAEIATAVDAWHSGWSASMRS